MKLALSCQLKWAPRETLGKTVRDTLRDTVGKPQGGIQEAIKGHSFRVLKVLEGPSSIKIQQKMIKSIVSS